MSTAISVYEALTSSIAERITSIREGFPATEVEKVSDALGVSKNDVVVIIGTPLRTANRLIKEQRRLDPGASERLLRIVEIEKRAEEVFGHKGMASEWLTSFNEVLGGEPMHLLDTELGANQVRRVLNAIEHGLPV